MTQQALEILEQDQSQQKKKPSQGVIVNSENTSLSSGRLTQPAQPSHVVLNKFQQHFYHQVRAERRGLGVSFPGVGGFKVGSCPALAELPFCLH